MSFNAVYFESVVTFGTSKSSLGHHVSPTTQPAKTKVSAAAGSVHPHALACAVAAPRSENYVFGGKRDGEVIAWNMFTSRSKAHSDDDARPSAPQAKITSLGHHKGGVTCIAYYPNRKLLFTGSSDTTICVWDPLQVYQKTSGSANGFRMQLIPAHESTVTALAVHCNIVISGSVDKTVKVWMLDDRREGLAIPFFVAKQAFVFDNWITALYSTLTKATEVQSEDIYVGDASGNLTTLHTAMAPVITKGGVEDSSVVHVELVRHTRLLDTGPSLPGTSDTTPRSIVAIFPLPNVNSLVTLGFELSATITDASKMTPLGHIEHPEANGTNRASVAATRFVDIQFLSAREELVLLDSQGTIFLWDTRTNQYLFSRKSNPKQHVRALVGYSNIGFGASPSFLRSVEECFFAVHDEGLEMISVVHVKTVTELKGHEGRIISVVVNPLSEYAALSAQGKLADQSSREQIAAETSEVDAPGSASDSQDIAFVTVGVDNKICMWSSRLSLLRSFVEKYSEISSFCFSPHLDQCVTGHDNGSVKFWGLSRERRIRFAAHDNTVSFVGEGLHRYDKRHDQMLAWRHFFTISYDGCLAVWEAPVESSKPKCDGRVRVSNSELVCAAYDPLKYAYLVGDNNGTISMWSVDDLKPLRQFMHTIRHAPTTTHRLVTSVVGSKRPAHREAVTGLALDGNIAVSGSEDKKMYMWNTMTGECIKELNTTLRTAELPNFANSGFGEVEQIHVAPDTGDIIACTRSGLVLQFNQLSGEPSAFYRAQSEVSAVCINPFGGEVLIGLESGSLLRTPFTLFRSLTKLSDGEDDDVE